MEDKLFIAPSDAQWLSYKGWMTSIPENCVFHKGITGCGATTLAIKQPGNTILAMPFTNLVDNKVASNPNLLGIHGGMNKEAKIANYIKSHDPFKIAVTYDSFPKVCDILCDQGLDPYKDFFLFVDEYHVLFNSYKFRNRAARALLDYSKKFDRKTFVSATPIPREYWLTEFQDLPEFRIEWPEAETVHINSLKVEDPIVYMARLCKSRANKGGYDNYHIFLNSVEGIIKIIRLAGLRPEQCRIVCSQSDDDTKQANQAKLGEYEIQVTTDPVKMFNFYTSTCFEGQDIMDPVGRTFIVSEACKDHTKLDVMTSLLQICGRVRDSEFKTEINQFYAQSDYKDISLEEFKENQQRQIADAEHDAELLNELSEGGKELIKIYVNKAPYLGVDEETGQIIVDRNLANFDIVNYGIINGQYKTQCNMNNALSKAGFQVTNDTEAYNTDEELENLTSIEKTPFKDIFEEYAKLRANEGMYNLGIFRASRIEIEKPLVKEAYDILGPEKVRELKYHQSNIKRELTKRMHETLDTKIFLLLDAQLPKQVAIPKVEITAQLDAIYKELKIQKKAKATDIKAWYDIKETTKRGSDGKTLACMCILSSRIKVAR